MVSHKQLFFSKFNFNFSFKASLQRLNLIWSHEIVEFSRKMQKCVLKSEKETVVVSWGTKIVSFYFRMDLLKYENFAGVELQERDKIYFAQIHLARDNEQYPVFDFIFMSNSSNKTLAVLQENKSGNSKFCVETCAVEKGKKPTPYFFIFLDNRPQFLREIVGGGGSGKAFLVICGEFADILHITTKGHEKVSTPLFHHKALFCSEGPVGKTDRYLATFSDGSMASLQFVRNVQDSNQACRVEVKWSESFQVRANSVVPFCSTGSSCMMFMGSDCGDSALALMEVESGEVRLLKKLHSCGKFRTEFQCRSQCTVGSAWRPQSCLWWHIWRKCAWQTCSRCTG